MIQFELATPADDAELRALLRTHPLTGRVSLSFEREPSFFSAAAVEGPFHQTVVARDPGAVHPAGMVGRSIRALYVNGVARPIGYFSQFRARADRAWGLALARVVARGIHFLGQLHSDGRAPFYLVSIIADNLPARRLLTAAGPGLPTLVPYAALHTFALAVGRLRRAESLPSHLHLRAATADDLPGILDCLARNGPRRQFTPCWTRDTLCRPAHTPNLRPEDFHLVLDGRQVVGCVALWNQMPFKQTIVRGYSALFRRARPLLNAMARTASWPALPAVGQPIRHAFASHLAVDGDDQRVLAALLCSAHNRACDLKLSYVMLGLAPGDPFHAWLRRSYRHLTYASQIYLAAWPDGLDAVAAVDKRHLGLDVALL